MAVGGIRNDADHARDFAQDDRVGTTRAGELGPKLPADFATFAAYGDFATGVLAMLALLSVRQRPLFWLFVVAFNVVGVVLGLPTIAGQLGAGYAIPIIYVPLLMITHVAAFYLLLRPQPQPRTAAQLFAGATS